MMHPHSLYCPYDAPVHPEMVRAERESAAWAARMGVLTPINEGRFHAARFSSLAARTHGYADFDVLRLALDWIVWLFARDDTVDAAGHDDGCRRAFVAAHGERAVLRGREPARRPLERALGDLRERIIERGGTAWLERFTRAVEEYLDANAWELDYQRAGYVPDLPTYRELRRASGAVRTTFVLAALGSDIPPDSPWLDDVRVRTLADLANDHVCWVNDLFGLDKEIREGHRNNVVLVLEAHERVPLAEARRLALRRCDELTRAYADLESHVSELIPDDEPARRLLRVFRRWMRGNLDWYGDTGRYAAGAASPFREVG